MIEKYFTLQLCHPNQANKFKSSRFKYQPQGNEKQVGKTRVPSIINE